MPLTLIRLATLWLSISTTEMSLDDQLETNAVFSSSEMRITFDHTPVVPNVNL